MISLLTYTSLYPNPCEPRRGIFVEQRLLRLIASGRVSATVVAPVAWSPRWGSVFDGASGQARIPCVAERNGLQVHYPRFVSVPGLSGWANPVLMAHASRSTIDRLRRQSGDFDIIDAQYFYPDGVAGAILGRWLSKPVTITARGTDVNYFSTRFVPRGWIRWAATQSAAIFTVSEALKDTLLGLGIPEGRIIVTPNGVDLDLFSPGDRDHSRRSLALNGTVLLSIGNLVPEKGHDLVIKALAHIEHAQLVIVGAGPAREPLRALSERIGVADRIRWVEYVPQRELPNYYTAADATVLASTREGMPNVLLESMACGTPVIASNVGGVAEIVAAPEAGKLLPERSPDAIVAAWRELAIGAPARQETRSYAQRFGWDVPVARQLEVLSSVAGAKSQ